MELLLFLFIGAYILKEFIPNLVSWYMRLVEWKAEQQKKAPYVPKDVPRPIDPGSIQQPHNQLHGGVHGNTIP